MLELNTTPQDKDLVRDVTSADFMSEVVEASQEVPVIVDFWAPWCGPCKTLGPMLEAAVLKANGAVRMAKVDIDQNQMIAAQLRVQSVPTVFAFFKGQPVDGFQGAIPASEIEDFVNRVAALGGGQTDGGLDDAVAAAEEMLSEGAAVDAAQTFAAVLGEEAHHGAAYGGLVRAHIAMGELDQAEAILNGAPDEISATPEVEAASAQLALAHQAAQAGPVADLLQKVASEPDNYEARLQLAQAQHASGDMQGAIDSLLELFRLDRTWNDEAAKKQLFIIFDALKGDDPLVLNGRRRLSSMIFA